MDLKISELVARGRLAAEACAWELRLDGCLTRPPTAADLIALNDGKARTDSEARAMLRGLFVAEFPAGLSESGEQLWGVDEATALLQSYTEYFKVWQPKKQKALAIGVAGAVREALESGGMTPPREGKSSAGKPG